MLQAAPVAETQVEPAREFGLLMKGISGNRRRVEIGQDTQRFLKPRAWEVGELPGPVSPIATTSRRAEGIAIHQAQRAGCRLDDERPVGSRILGQTRQRNRAQREESSNGPPALRLSSMRKVVRVTAN